MDYRVRRKDEGQPPRSLTSRLNLNKVKQSTKSNIYLEEGGPAAAVRLSGRSGCGRHDCEFAPGIEISGDEVVAFATGDFEKRSRVLYPVGTVP